MILLRVIEIYLLLINIWGFFIMGFDKRKARRNKWRIPEKEFFLTAAAGGSLGVWLGMRTFHHKTQHKSFTIGIPCIFFLQLFLLGFCIYRSLRI